MSDQVLEQVAQALLGPDPSATGVRIAQVLRDTIDQLLDGVHTGRYLWDDLYKTEKTHAGTLVEINVQREFKFDNGDVLDFKIVGHEVDCKFSQSEFGWMIPPEAIGHLCMVVWANDEKALWSCGLVRADEVNLTPGHNRDQKRQISAAGRPAIRWLFSRQPLPPNIFLQLDPAHVALILDPDISGQQGVNRLFRYACGLLVGRGAVLTAGQQDDSLKRVRGNGGSREKLQPEGIVIFGHEHQDLAYALQLPVPSKGEFVSIRLTSRTSPGRPYAMIDGRAWSVAVATDPVEMAPELPRAPSSDDRPRSQSRSLA